jgi:hypothetical protein
VPTEVGLELIGREELVETTQAIIVKVVEEALLGRRVAADRVAKDQRPIGVGLSLADVGVDGGLRKSDSCSSGVRFGHE